MENENVEVKGNSFETADLGLAAYLKMKGIALKEIGKGKDKRFRFIFETNNGEVDKYKVQYINSECFQFDSNVKILKLMIKSGSV